MPTQGNALALPYGAIASLHSENNVLLNADQDLVNSIF
jgi:hypothetical protein